MDSNNNSQYFDKWAKEYKNLPDENSFHLRHVGKLIQKKYSSHLDGSNLRILDLGVGNGRFLSALELQFSKIVGIDVSDEQLKLAGENLTCKTSDLTLIKYDLEKGFPLESESMDMIVSNATIHHIKDKSELFGEAYRVLKKNGVFVFFDFYFDEIGIEVRDKIIQNQIEYPEMSKKFIDSIREEHNLMPGHLEESHPAEYRDSPLSLIELLKGKKFKGCEILPTFYLKYMGIGCIK